MNYLELDNATMEELQEERDRLIVEKAYILNLFYDANIDVDFNRVGELKIKYETRLASIEFFQKKIDRLLTLWYISNIEKYKKEGI